WKGSFTSTDADGTSNKYEVEEFFRVTVVDVNAKDGKVTLKLEWSPDSIATFEGETNGTLELRETLKGNLMGGEKAHLSEIKLADGTMTGKFKRASGSRIGSFSVTKRSLAAEQLGKGFVWRGSFTSTDPDGKSNKVEVEDFWVTVVDANAKDGRVTLKLEWGPDSIATFEGENNGTLELRETLKGNPTRGEKAWLSLTKVTERTITGKYRRASGSRIGSFSVTRQ